ncbi:hypothetical protein [Gallibacterium sp. AGMB14963]|uniref:hypothetical protein n=1 Tax=Gallibacterium faecale TaxID=3019086 RepID=UPI0022F17B99|nr:hypothetical protein [Gallibacterium sp. AGMB14963]MDA3977539.1 hypothetical protein [Gallibacterium sp. AGMB14963]
MKKFLILICGFILAGCIYDRGCFRPLIETVATQCEETGTLFPLIAGYQKPETLGKTDSNKRWNDWVSCGGKYGDINIDYYPQNYKLNGKFYTGLRQCMLEKGYIFLPPAQCGYQEPKYNTGKCNL